MDDYFERNHSYFKRYEEGTEDEKVQCWHTEPGTPCDWNKCNQPERLAAGDIGNDPANGMSTPNLDRIRRMQ